MRDIPGAAFGAAQFAEWLQQRFNDPRDLPLSTVRVLLAPVESERNAIGDHVIYLDATRDNVSAALESWYKDCDSHADNVAIIYVAGHGIVSAMPGNPLSVFLAGANFVQDRYHESVSMLSVDGAMNFCKATTNIFLYDCCAKPHQDVPSRTGLGLQAYDERGEQRKFRLTIAAARVGDSAYADGASNGTLLSQSLIPLLSTAGEIVQNRFAITRNRLADELQNAIRDRLRKYKGYQQESRVRGDHPHGGIHRPIPPPRFEVKLVSNFSSTANEIDYSIQEYGSPTSLSEGVLKAGVPAKVVLPAGEYLLKAKVSSAEVIEKLVVDRDLSQQVSGPV